MTRRETLVHLGYEVGTGEPVTIPLRHMVVTGQTQESGKTTTLEAVIARSGVRAIAFTTKRGESVFAYGAAPIPPYFHERADWKFVESIIETTMKAKQNQKQAWIVRACEGCRTLREVAARAAKLESTAKHPMSKDMYMLLGEYLKIVIPLIDKLPQSSRMELSKDGVSVMHLEMYPRELQMLVIASTLEWVHRHEEKVITIIPEAWKFCPNKRNSPVKLVAEDLVREGAALKNFVWVDSQDIAGVSYEVLRQCAVWLFGVQRQVNEVKRVIANMPEGIKAPKPADVATLDLGQFYVAHGKELCKVYVQPAWLPAQQAIATAQGNFSPAMRQKPRGIVGRRFTFDDFCSDCTTETQCSIKGGCQRIENSLSQNTHPAGEGARSSGKSQALPINFVPERTEDSGREASKGEGKTPSLLASSLAERVLRNTHSTVTEHSGEKHSFTSAELVAPPSAEVKIPDPDDPWWGDKEAGPKVMDSICPNCEDEAAAHVLVEGSGLEDEGTLMCLDGDCKCKFSADDYPDFTRRVLAAHGQMKEEEMPKVWTEEELLKAMKPEPRQFVLFQQFVRALIPIINQGSSAAAEGKDGAESSGLNSRKQTSAPSDYVVPAVTELGRDVACNVSTLDGAREAAVLNRQQLIADVIAEIRKDPVLIRLSQEKPVIEVKIERKVVKVDGSIKGKIAGLIHKEFFTPNAGMKFSDVKRELVRRGLDPKTPNFRIAEPLKELTQQGFFYRGTDDSYVLASDAEIVVVD